MELIGDLLQDDDENIELWYIMVNRYIPTQTQTLIRTVKRVSSFGGAYASIPCMDCMRCVCCKDKRTVLRRVITLCIIIVSLYTYLPLCVEGRRSDVMFSS